MRIKAKKDTIRKFLIENNLTQQQFCKECGLTSNYISELMSDRKEPSPTTRAKIIKTMERIGKRRVKFSDVFYIEEIKKEE